MNTLFSAILTVAYSLQTELRGGCKIPVSLSTSQILSATFFFLRLFYTSKIMASQVALVVKNPPANAGDIRGLGSIPGLGRSLGEENGNSLQYSGLENLMDRGAWRATVLGHKEWDTTEAT